MTQDGNDIITELNKAFAHTYRKYNLLKKIVLGRQFVHLMTLRATKTCL